MYPFVWRWKVHIERLTILIIYSNILLYIWECSHCTLSSIELITHYLFLHILLLQR